MGHTQFRFRPKRGTGDALMIIRRIIDAAHMANAGGISILLLDWAKAFDRLKPDCMCDALGRFGVPVEMVDMIRSIYRARYFEISDHTGLSSERSQKAGIAQGCPLSPYLFIAVQSVMLHDVFDKLSLIEEPAFLEIRDLLYADDTLLMSAHTSNLQAMLDGIVEEGARYGLELNWKKTVQMQIGTPSVIKRPDGQDIDSVRQAVYLGGCITCDGKATSEISRRIGECKRYFQQLQQVWAHASITTTRKIEIYSKCITTRLLYSLDSLWLLQADRARLDAFHHQCLRKILRIPPSFISRVENTFVLERSGLPLMSEQLLTRQRQVFVKIRDHGNDLIKHLLFTDSGQPQIWNARRKRGRPRQRWITEVSRHMI